MDEVKLMLETNQFDVLAVCETHLSKKIGNRQLQVDVHRTIRRDRPDGRRGGGGGWNGGLCIGNSDCSTLETFGSFKIEAIWLRTVTKSSSVTIGSFYRPSDNTAFFEDIVIPIEKAWYKYKNLVLVGDFNANFSKTAHGHELRLQEKLMSELVNLTVPS